MRSRLSRSRIQSPTEFADDLRSVKVRNGDVDFFHFEALVRRENGLVTEYVKWPMAWDFFT